NLTTNPDGRVPYSVAIGNHDYVSVSNRASGANRYPQFFGASRYAGRSWYGGASANQLNHYQRFTAGEWTFLHITIQWEAPAADLAWAQSIIDANPGMPTFITTHSYMNVGASAGRTTNPQSSGGSSGETIFQTLVAPNDQVFMVLNGHFHGEYTQTSTNFNGRPVFEMVADYQSRVNGGDGWMRLLTFDPDNNRIQVRTYSPTLNQWETDADSQFQFNVNLRQRLAPGVGTDFITTFRNGERNYTGTLDTQLSQAAATTNYDQATTIGVDAATNATSNDSLQSLVRFSNIIGPNPGQIPANAIILNAELVLQTTNLGHGGQAYRVKQNWGSGTTWNSWNGGLNPDGTELQAAYDTQIGFSNVSVTAPTGSTRINVTSDLQAWADGELNLGWGILPWTNGTDGWGFASSESATVSQRPQLRVEWTPDSATFFSYQQGTGFRRQPKYAGTSDTTLYGKNSTTSYATTPTIIVDGPDNTDTRHATLGFFSLFGNKPGQIPLGTRIEWAKLYLSTPYTESNAPGGGAMFHRIQQRWRNGSTWANSFGGDGIQANNIEARSTMEFNTAQTTFGTKGFDVTESLQAWSDGAPNFGWVMLFNNSDAWIISSADREIVGERPRLVLSFDPREGMPTGEPGPRGRVATDGLTSGVAIEPWSRGGVDLRESSRDRYAARRSSLANQR
ncbi:MAG: DNRLRE domain-containing protein, partial [Gemmataceae bacterium]